MASSEWAGAGAYGQRPLAHGEPPGSGWGFGQTVSGMSGGMSGSGGLFNSGSLDVGRFPNDDFSAEDAGAPADPRRGGSGLGAGAGSGSAKESAGGGTGRSGRGAALSKSRNSSIDEGSDTIGHELESQRRSLRGTEGSGSSPGAFGGGGVSASGRTRRSAKRQLPGEEEEDPIDARGTGEAGGGGGSSSGGRGASRDHARRPAGAGTDGKGGGSAPHASHGASSRTSEHVKGASNSANTLGDDDDDEEAGGEKKQRFVWSPEVHQCFCDAVHHLGVDKAKPQAIAALMQSDASIGGGPNMPTRQNIKSHLQKYRLLLAKRKELEDRRQHEPYGSQRGGGHGGGHGRGRASSMAVGIHTGSSGYDAMGGGVGGQRGHGRFADARVAQGSLAGSVVQRGGLGQRRKADDVFSGAMGDDEEGGGIDPLMGNFDFGHSMSAMDSFQGPLGGASHFDFSHLGGSYQAGAAQQGLHASLGGGMPVTHLGGLQQGHLPRSGHRAGSQHYGQHPGGLSARTGGLGSSHLPGGSFQITGGAISPVVSPTRKRLREAAGEGGHDAAGEGGGSGSSAESGSGLGISAAGLASLIGGSGSDDGSNGSGGAAGNLLSGLGLPAGFLGSSNEGSDRAGDGGSDEGRAPSEERGSDGGDRGSAGGGRSSAGSAGEAAHDWFS